MYWFLDATGHVLYVGKAKKLKDRVSSYTQLNQLAPRIFKLVHTAVRLKHQVLESELEALLVEAELIRIHQPPFNVALKDDKTPLYIYVTNDLYPQVKTLRKKDIESSHYPGTILGPFPSGYKVKEVLKIVRHIFPWCSKPPAQVFTPGANASTKPQACFYYHLQLCPGACVGEILPETYRHTIGQLVAFLKGQKKQVVRDMTTEMKQASAAEEFERAAELRDKLEIIRAVTDKSFRLKPDLTLPQLRETRAEEGLVQLAKLVSQHMHLPRTLRFDRIECYDVSNTQGQDAAVAMVTFTDGVADSVNYRLFNIRTLDTPNDYHMLKEALARRQDHAEWGVPDLVVIDGGKGQLRAVKSVWTWQTPVISIAKDPDRLIIPITSSLEPTRSKSKNSPEKLTYAVIELPTSHPALQLVAQLRDEAHRFSKKQHHRRHQKGVLL